MPKRVIIMGAAGRDFHNFNVYFRNNPNYEVVAFTATQIPGIEKRIYPPELAGPRYPNGIPIYPEEKLPELIREYNVDEVIFSYSDVSHEYVMHRASIALANGATFKLLGPKDTMLKSTKPVIAVCAARTGAGKSTVSRKVARVLKDLGVKVVVIRHPMPYGDLRKQICQRFEKIEDLEKYECTIEEKEEYEPHLNLGLIVYAGVDYEKILREAEKEAEIILWDGGNNDYPFYKPDLLIVVVDPLRPGHELKYFPGEVNVRMADVIIVNKVNSAKPEDVNLVIENVKKVNPNAIIIRANSEVSVDKPELIKGKKVVVIEDGPTLLHGDLTFGAGYIAAKKYGASEIVSPLTCAVGSIRKVVEERKCLAIPALGYGPVQLKELEETLAKAECDTIIMATPTDLRRFIKIDKPVVKVSFELEEIDRPSLRDILKDFISKIKG
ncbi:MAG: GTPase [Candidatus Methanomethylicota archaeon]|uniref:GTPase n=1 Tax=Thermoproteota archaeon TaxID=2056631 RepID=A0A497EU35_9CREN|nr:MAG: GTPase [Candidatus Verstraetearchaeota archaeon]